MKNLFSIGELSKYQNISKQTLIYYDKIGLFQPSYIDPKNQYRFYSADQIDYLDTIIILKKLGFSLNEIKSFMKNYTLEHSMQLFQTQLSAIQQKIEELQYIQTRLQHRYQELNALKEIQLNDVYLGQMDSNIYVFVQEVKAPNTLKEVSIATKQCYAQAFEKQIPIYFQSGVIVSEEKIRKKQYEQASYAFVLSDFYACEDIKTLPKGDIIYSYHYGAYEQISKTYQRIFDYSEQHHLQLQFPAYEFCIHDYITSNHENEFITKIVFYRKA